MQHTAAQSAEGLIKAERSVVLMITQSGHLSIRPCFSEPVFLCSRSLRDFPSHGQSVCMLTDRWDPLALYVAHRPSNGTGPAHSAAEHHGKAGSSKMSQHTDRKVTLHTFMPSKTSGVQQNKSEQQSRVLKLTF